MKRQEAPAKEAEKPAATKQPGNGPWMTHDDFTDWIDAFERPSITEARDRTTQKSMNHVLNPNCPEKKNLCARRCGTLYFCC